MLIYADFADLPLVLSADQRAELTEENTASAFRYASMLVRRATRNDWYGTDEDGYPTHEPYLEAFKMATLSQIASWVVLECDLTTLETGTSATEEVAVTSTSINGATVQLDSGAKKAAQAETLTRLTPNALAYLTDVGLGSHVIGRVYG